MNVATCNDTHDPALRSWIASANEATTDFPLQNLPFGVFRRAGTNEAFRGGVAIGDSILDLASLHESRSIVGDAADALAAAARAPLNAFMQLGHDATHALRVALSRALRHDSALRARLEPMLVVQRDAEMTLPAAIGDYTDFYTSIHHARAVGEIFRPTDPLLPNYKWVPIAYHGRASSIVVSGTPIVRPTGQIRLPGSAEPVLEPTRRLDYEMEMGIAIGRPNALGSPIDIERAEDHVFGCCLLNDWSARDVQSWEYQPLGPFLGKSFGTSISPWLVTLEALAPYRVERVRPATDPAPLPYLREPNSGRASAFDVSLSVALATRAMRERGERVTLSRSNFSEAYWSIAQMIAHHTINGCNLRAGDLLGTGTLSGSGPNSTGSLLEQSAGGSTSIVLPGGEQRTFLEDGDDVRMSGTCHTEGRASIGFGSVHGVVLAAGSSLGTSSGK